MSEWPPPPDLRLSDAEYAALDRRRRREADAAEAAIPQWQMDEHDERHGIKR